MKTDLPVIVLLSIVIFSIICGSPVFVFSSLSSVSPSSLALTSSLDNNNHQSLQSFPIANAGPNQVVTAGSTVIHNGSNSRAHNEVILSYSWRQIPTDAQTTLSGVNTPVWEFIAPNVTADTLLRFQLKVMDNLGQSSTASVNVLDKPASTSIVPLATKISQSTAAPLSTSVKTGNNENVINTKLLSSLPLVHTKLFMVRIISPIKDQQIPVHSGLNVSGISVANSTSGFCYVSVVVNGIKPYSMTVATGKGGANDYSTWSYKLASTYAVIKPGQNRITAKFSCANNPSLTSYNSVNVIGVANNNNNNVGVVASSPQHALPPNNSKLLLTSLNLAKNPISTGEEETLKIRVFDVSNPNATISGAKITGIAGDSNDTTTINFNGVTDNSGTFTYKWMVDDDSRPGLFTVSVLTSATGYKSQLIPTKATFKVDSAVIQQQEVAPQHIFNCRLFISKPGPCA